ncbi:MAG: hypothetical protein PHO15_00255 [Eubacteriales bacterium]|nr:hypothetical protein [Eubacteriales bacterium]
MICGKCKHVNKDGVAVCKYCGAKLEGQQTDAAPSSITIDVPPVYQIIDDDGNDSRPFSKSIITLIAVLGSLIVMGLIVMAVLLVVPPDSTAAATTVETMVPTETPAETPTETPTEVPIQTTDPEPTDDFSSLFEEPTDAVATE